MAKRFIAVYVFINIAIVLLNLIHNMVIGEVIQVLDGEDWLVFIIACGSLAICETLEKGESK